VEASGPRIRADEDADGLAVSIDTTTPGTLDGTVTVRGTLGEAVVRVHADVTVPVEEPAAVAARPVDPVPAAAVPAPQRAAVDPAAADPAAVDPAAVDPAAVDPAAADPGAVDPTPVDPAARNRRPERASTGDPAPTSVDDPWVRLGGGLAVVGTALLVAGALGKYRYDELLRELDPSWLRHTFVLAALVAAAAALALWARTRWTAGTGLLLGVVTASSWNLVTLIAAWVVLNDADPGMNTGFWLMVTGQGVVVLSGVATARAVAGRPGFGLGSPLVPRALVWSLVSAGVLAGAAVVYSATRPYESGFPWVLPAWMALTATAIPAAVALARPSWFGVWMLAGWVVGAGAGLVRYVDISLGFGANEEARAVSWIMVAVAALVPLGVVLARYARRDGMRDEPAGGDVRPGTA
jgi:hypothetical protein